MAAKKKKKPKKKSQTPQKSIIKVEIQKGLWTAVCTQSLKKKDVGKTYTVQNPYFKCKKLVGLYPGRIYEAKKINGSTIKLINTKPPFNEK